MTPPNDPAQTDKSQAEDRALEGIAVSPPSPGAPPVPEVREGVDAGSHQKLAEDPSDPDAKLDVALDETFPTSDAPSNTRPGSGEPAESSGYDPETEKRLAEAEHPNADKRVADGSNAKD